MNLGTAKERIAMLINQYSERGELKDPADDNVVDLYNKMPHYLDIAQKNVAQSKPIKKNFAISHILPLSCHEWQLQTHTHTDTDITYSSAKALAYSFKVDNDATVYIEGIGQDNSVTELMEIFAYSENGFTLFKGNIYPPEDVTFKAVQLRFSGDTFYNIKDIALYEAKYSHYDKIPDFGRHINYEMPKDFIKIISAKIKKNSGYFALDDMVWESPTTLAVSVYEQGEIKIEYEASPSDITSDTADTYEFDIQPQAQDKMILYAAALLVQKEDYAQYQLLMQQYSEGMANLNLNNVVRQTRIKRVR